MLFIFLITMQLIVITIMTIAYSGIIIISIRNNCLKLKSEVYRDGSVKKQRNKE